MKIGLTIIKRAVLLVIARHLVRAARRQRCRSRSGRRHGGRRATTPIGDITSGAINRPDATGTVRRVGEWPDFRWVRLAAVADPGTDRQLR